MSTEDKKQIAAQQYALKHFTDVEHLNKIKDAWLDGFETAVPKWINIEDELPEDDRTVVCWAENTENSLYSELKLGNYINEKWYCKGGRNSQEIITKWQKIAE